MPKPSTTTATITDFQERVYNLLVQIPSGRVSTYGSLARALSTSPRAVGNALRHNPFAPEVPCHRVITSSGYIGGFMGECNAAPSGVNQRRKRELLGGEGVVFDEEGMLVGGGGGGGGGGEKGQHEVLFDGPWDLSGRFKRAGVDGK